VKLVVIGLGSMGKRRIRLLSSHMADKVQVFGVDTREDRRNEVEQQYGIRTYADLENALLTEQPIGALICTSPHTHPPLTLLCLHKQLHVFSEINLLLDSCQSIIEMAEARQLTLFLSSTLLYRKEIDYIRHAVNANKGNVHYRYHVGQYLPDWHPWESYKDFFVGHRSTNGCRELFAIELPWIIRTFGPIKTYHAVRDRISSLEIDYPDSYLVTLEHEGGHKGVLHVDVVSRKAIRSLEIYGEQLHICWEGTPHSLSAFNLVTKQMEQIETYKEIDQDQRYAANIIENAYLEELVAYIGQIEGQKGLAKYSFIDDLTTLSLIDRIEGGTK
jgi:predicted dehydrogenase